MLPTLTAYRQIIGSYLHTAHGGHAPSVKLDVLGTRSIFRWERDGKEESAMVNNAISSSFCISSILTYYQSTITFYSPPISRFGSSTATMQSVAQIFDLSLAILFQRPSWFLSPLLPPSFWPFLVPMLPFEASAVVFRSRYVSALLRRLRSFSTCLHQPHSFSSLAR